MFDSTAALVSKLYIYSLRRFGGFIILLLYFISVILLSPVYIFRLFIFKTSQCLNPSLGKMLTARGHFVAAEKFEKASRMAIVAAAGVATDKTSEEMKSFIVERLLMEKASEESDHLKYPELQQCLTIWCGFRFWTREENFQINDHFKIIPPGQKPFTTEDLNNIMETLVNEPFPAGRSPWDIYIIEDYCDDKTSSEKMKLAIIKIHHALADGYGLLFTFLENLSTAPVPLPEAKYAKSSRSIWRTIGFIIAFPFRVILEALELATMYIQPHPWKIPDSKKSWKLIYSQSEIIPVKKIKEIKTRFKVSFASVAHSACASATRQSLLKSHETFKDLEYTRCAAMLPLPDHPKKLRNHFTAGSVKLPTGNIDPIQRLQECEEDLQFAKRSVMPYLVSFSTLAFGGFNTSIVKLLAHNRAYPVIISNFPVGAVNSKIQLFGENLLRLAVGIGAGPGDVGVCIFVYSYGDSIQFSVTAENAIMTKEELQHFMDCIVQEIDALYQLTVV